MKKLKSVILLITLILVFNINISYGRENKISNHTTHIVTVEKNNLLAFIQDSRLQQNHSIDENDNSTDNDSKSTKVCDFNPQKVEVTKDNTITIPDVCTNACLSIGSTQEAVNQYDICIMTEANNSNFGDDKLRPVLLGGHNTKSLKYLYSAHLNDVITVYYNNNQYEYKIIYSNECINDGYKLYDIDTGINMLDYYVNQEILYIYTCYGKNNWLVKAVRI
ncbi:hypothetical protein [Thomasclavelia saccharogumia]|uniref:hypothetical protein n=1 Tax=Thomasclavelia saccharogumia TaxID=341225 RepID=UPI000478BBCB|nr:hypothetical protein [Thomasclavelia saccharogumia]